MTIDEIRAQYAQALADMRAADGKDDEAAFTEAEGRMTAAKSRLTRAEKMDAEERWGRQAPEDDKPPTDQFDAAGETRDEPQCPKLFRSLGEQFVHIIRADKGIAVDPRLRQLNAWSTRAVSGMSETPPSDGGWFVQTDLSTELIKNSWETGLLSSRCRPLIASSNANSIKMPAIDETSRANGSRWGGVYVYWEGDGETTTAKKFKTSLVTLELKKMKGVAYAGNDLQEDASLLESWLGVAFPEEMGFRLDDAIFRGEGTSSPLGYINAPCLVTVPKETNQVADTVLSQNVLKMWARLAPACKPKSVWFINGEVEPQLAQMYIAAGTGGQLIYTPANGLSVQGYSTLMGRPVIPIEQASALGDVGDITLVDLSQYYLLRKRGVQAASSIHVKFVEDETCFKWTLRVDGKPAWKSAITPYKGGASSSISPFVALAARA